MLSYWEKNTLIHFDVLIIGGGIVGLSTAASLLEANPALKVCVLERGILPSGASTKNAGFACFGSVSELWQDLVGLGKERMLALVKQRWEGLDLLRKRLGDEQIGYLSHGGYELIRESELGYLDNIELINEHLFSLFGRPVFTQNDSRIVEFGFPHGQVKAIIENPFEAQIDTGAMMDSLWNYVSKLGGRILTGAEVLGWEVGSENIRVAIKNSLTQGEFELSSKQLVCASNAFSGSFFSDLDLQPGRGQVLVTEPISDLKVKGVFHMDEGYYYFRNVGDRLMLGGGRNLDKVGERTLEMDTTALIQHKLQELIDTLILPGQQVEIELTWAGIMAFGNNKEPICQQVDDRVFIAVRLGGMGVAIGSKLGQKVAKMVLEEFPLR